MERLLVLALLAAIFACDNSEDSVLPGHDGAALRITNNSDFVIAALEVTPGGGGTQIYEDIAPGATTAYLPFDFIYSYAYLEAIVEGDTLVLQPFDYVGATAYDSGAYTYLVQISGDTAPESLSIEFQED
ncbi:hypothetical protein [Phaeodactylibacter sp.]|jgi:hypothetical protein|uniref:hypothetical protein n=1 Tax=Phaeodactylibacter sp. TaxID=1940289 RepID=UPI0025EF97DE|nr:hypothetical protein [Phaeodactylibacter sp.]MCI4648646.1 hypothetical protein [Phaeodactylibacter sp.]MCI5091227.1 hypothetical protein [Phaeodactylibacter sp.]